MDLVVGATGLLGSEICRRLRHRGEDVRALVRKTSDAAKVDALKDIGCHVVTGDLQDPASLDRACHGVEVIISTATTTVSRQPHDSLEKTDQQGQLNLIDAAERNDVKRFVLVSFSGNLEVETNLHRAKRTVEAKLRESGVAYAILRPSFFMEVWLSPMLGFDPGNRKVQIFGAGDRPVSFISLSDVAEFAVRVAEGDAGANQTIELGGPEALTPNEVVSIFEQEAGARFDVTHVPEEKLQDQLANATDEYQKSFAGLMLGVCEGDDVDMQGTLRRIPVTLTSVLEYARRASAGVN
ncbi:MAG TPA: SDR family oxidoreductase [Thermoanaerobaculia bacterium]